MHSNEVQLGLRERKKIRTRQTIQEQALRLFAAQGYAETTTEQIAAAAEVSPSTFFRYFPTKEETVLYDPIDPMLFQIFVEQPAEMAPLDAMRAAFRTVFENIPVERTQTELERQKIIFQIPELRNAVYERLGDIINLMADAVAQRTGRQATDVHVRSWAGAVTGALTATFIDPEGRPTTHDDDFPVRMLDVADAALAHLDAGLPL